MIKRLLTVLLFLSGAFLAGAQKRFSVGTDVIRILELGTINAEASIAVSQHVSVYAGGAVNPWTYNKGDADRQMENRNYSFWAGARWWPWHVYSGWWAGADGKYMCYNRGGIFKRQTEEGDAYGGSLRAGYSIMLSETWNLDISAGAWAGWKSYTVYSCPLCGRIEEKGSKAFIVPDARVIVQLIF